MMTLDGLLRRSLLWSVVLLASAATPRDAAACVRAPDEASLRRTISREIRSRAPAKRVAAVNKLKGCKEEKTISLLAKVLKACAQARGKASYRADALAALVETISGIDKTERQLFKFGADCTAILGKVGGENFGAGKETPKKWQAWLKKNRAEILKEDKAKLAEYKKSSRNK